MAKYQRIISLVPSLTELVIDLGSGEYLTGRTRFCVHPADQVDDIPIMGGTKNPRLDKIRDANPDYIIANEEENRPEDIMPLAKKFDVRVTNIATINQAIAAIKDIGRDLETKQKADELTSGIEQRLEERPEVSPLRTAYMIWKEPWMSVGGDTYIHDVLDHWGLENVFAGQKRYPQFGLEELAGKDPELVLLSSEPYPFKEKHIAEVQQACPDARVLLVEGEWFSWYGSRMKEAFGRLNGWRAAIED